MSFERANTSSNELPIAESTQIEKSAKTPLRRLKMTLANRLGFNSNPNSPKETPPPKRITVNSPTLSKLDPQVYLDTQSNGFASRVVKYHEASEAKGREIANKTYRRPGDFPIVNFDKSEINLNQKQANAPKVSKINVATPINLVSASNASARSVIFRTGKNYGDSFPIGKLGPIEGRKPIKTTLPQDEPIVPTSNDYDNAPIRSSLEALKEISRKRIHCDEIDGDTNKKQRGDALNDFDQNSTPIATSSKRTRDRTSPSFCSSTTECQKKRYKNNDILSSLSSSILIDTPKRNQVSGNATPTKDFRHELNYNRKEGSENVPDNKKVTESSRVGTSNSDLPLHRSSEQIKPVIKSMSDGYVPPSQPTTKTNKITLFNKVYSATPSAIDKKNDDDDEDNSISFIKPKVKTSSIFGSNKNRDQKSKLAMMLSFLRGDESKDEVDSSVRKPLVGADKPEQKDEKQTSISSTPTNLSTITSVTFSTATTTSVLSVPSDATKSSIIEPPKIDNKEILKTPESTNTSSGFTLSTSVSTPSTNIIAPIPTTSENEKPQTSSESAIKSVASPTVTFNLPTTETATATATLNTTPSNSASSSAPRLGGFSFSANSGSFTSPLATKPVASEPIPSSKVDEAAKSTPAAPTFSFGLAPKSTGNTTLPSFTPSATQSSNIPRTSAPPAYNFGSPATNTSTISTNTGIAFSSVPASSSLATNPLGSNTSTAPTQSFGFGTVAKTTVSSIPSMTTPSITSTSGSNAFVFGSNVASTPAPTFGLGNTITVAATTSASSALSQATPAFLFGSTSNANKPELGGFQSNTLTNVTTSTLTFGTTSTAHSAFAFSANKPNTDAKPSFGAQTTQSQPTFGVSTTQPQQSGFGAFAPKFGENKNTTPTFGSISNPITTTSSTSIFGSSQMTPAFGSSNITAAQPKTDNVFGSVTNQATNTPVFGGQNSTSTFGKPANNVPTFGSANTSNIFGRTQNQPAFGASNSLFSTQTTAANPSQTSTSAFGSPAGVFAFGQSAPQPATTTAAAPTGIFGASNTNTSSNGAFVFGQSNTLQSTTPTQPSGIFGAKPAENAPSALSAPPAFGGTSPAFNFTAKPAFGNQPETKQAPFSFNTSNNAPSFGSTTAAAAPPQFGASNGIGSSFAFGSNNSQPEAAKSFNFSGPATAPAAAPASFSFSAPNQNAAAFQFSATPQPAANIFSIGPGSGTNTAKTGRPIRTAVRRMK